MAAMLERALDGGVLTLTLNRPDARNALTIELIRDLTEEVVKAAADDSVRCIVLTGRGKAFCAGGDIKQMLERKGKAMETRERLRGGLNPLALALHDIEKPVIARLNGDAVGAGCCLALNGDIVVAAESARIGLTFIRVGLVPDTGGTFNIPRLVGLQKAKLMHFTGDLISAREAEAIGVRFRRACAFPHTLCITPDMRSVTQFRLAAVKPVNPAHLAFSLHLEYSGEGGRSQPYARGGMPK